MDDDLWRWIWLAGVVVFTIGELATPGAFFMAPFAIGAAGAAVASFAGASAAVGWALFLGLSLAAFAGLRPLAHRLDRQGGNPVGVGASRLIGESALVVADIPGELHAHGVVRVGGEEWNAESDDGRRLEAGRAVRILEVRGTRLVVSPPDQRHRTSPPVA